MRLPNSVELVGYYGSDEAIACAAWTSTNREINDEKRGRISNLIKKLWEAGHETPAERGVVHFLVNVDQASHIHLLKHRISSINGESARYKELKEDKYYIPDDWPNNIVGNKDYRTDFGQFITKETDWKTILSWYTELGNWLYHDCLADLTPVLGRKRAKESARFFKTYNSQIQLDVVFNLRSFANFLKLRNSEHAQKEIREIAAKMGELVRQIPGDPFKHTMEIIDRKNKVLQIISDMSIEEIEQKLGINSGNDNNSH
jgi:flavin-dependent thymidylate synthase